MSNLFRRAGAAIARFFNSAADPAAEAARFQLYSKDTVGVSQLYGRSDDGTVYQITPPTPAAFLPGAIPFGSPFSGGKDGDVVFDGAATVLGLVPVANVYTMTLDIYPKNMTVNVGVTIKTMGYGIFGSATLTNNGVISDSGASAVGIVPGAARSGTNSGVRDTLTLGGGNPGGVGIASTGTIPYMPNAGSAAGGGAGAGAAGANGARCQGGGGGSGSAAGGVGGATTRQLAGALDDFIRCRTPSNSSYTNASGGGGGGNQGANTGGSGGAGAGKAIVCFHTLAGTGSIEAKGGNGSNAVGAGPLVCGGGAGGGGGLVLCVYSTNSGPVTFSTAGGTGGTGNGTAGSGPGGNGGDGYVILCNVSGDGT